MAATPAATAPATEEPAAAPQPCHDDAPWPFENNKRDAKLSRVVPTRDVPFGTVICKAGREVWRDSEGRIRVCTVARRVTLHGIDIADDAYSHFYANGRPFQTSIAHPQVLRTASGVAILCAGDHVVLSDAGALEHCKLDKPMTIAKVACRAGESVAFHPGGELRGATIDRPVRALGASFVEGTRLQWHPDGSLAGGWLREPMTLGGLLVQYDFRVYASGSMAELQLHEARRVNGHPFPAHSKIRLRPNGNLHSAEYESDSGFLPHGEQWSDTKHLRFDCMGGLVSSRVQHWQAPSR